MWTEVGGDTFAMASPALIGLAAHSHTTTELATATLDHVTITRGPTSDLVITGPAPGTTLLTTGATFEWTGAGDEFWLNIGSAPGASNIYASGSLGSARQHTVSGLPLNGTTLYVQLHRRVGAVTDVVNVRYTAPIRKGLAVVTDFADRRLEDYAGDGMNNVEDVSLQLREMEAHWAWLSRGLERIRWDIIRVTLAQPCVADAFSDWVQFRETVAGLVRQQVAVADYDVQGDGTIDSAWLIVSAGGNTPETGCAQEIDHYALGGSSANAGVAMFVDGQASGSVTGGATGNFNHELGHLLGLVDIYGPYDTVHGLTLMSFSWPVPPHDFAAYERMKLGWLEPQLLTETTRDVWLPSAHKTFAAVKIPTARAEEYFLIEYRKRPDSGYGSQNPFFNGLAVYHVLAGSSMSQNPPIVKLEPADGRISHDDGLNQADFVSPDNPELLQPMLVRSYFGDTPEVFRIENVRWQGDGIAFDVIIAPAQPPENLLVNPSFETGDVAAGFPDHWATSASSGVFTWPNPVASDGTRSVMMQSPSPNDMWWSQSVALELSHSYRLCGWLKGHNIQPPGGTGGSVSVIGALGGWVGSPGLVGTFDWTHSCIMFTTDAKTSRADVGCRLGHYLERVSGTLWCDDLSLERLRSAFP
jgi:M6 family metalloprotease-like protein